VCLHSRTGTHSLSLSLLGSPKCVTCYFYFFLIFSLSAPSTSFFVIIVVGVNIVYVWQKINVNSSIIFWSLQVCLFKALLLIFHSNHSFFFFSPTDAAKKISKHKKVISIIDIVWEIHDVCFIFLKKGYTCAYNKWRK
jgi:hypothetical protein